MIGLKNYYWYFKEAIPKVPIFIQQTKMLVGILNGTGLNQFNLQTMSQVNFIRGTVMIPLNLLEKIPILIIKARLENCRLL